MINNTTDGIAPEDKGSQLNCRPLAVWRFGFRVWRCHTARNMKKGAWIMEAIRDKLAAEEKDLPANPTLPPLPTNDEITSAK